MGKAASTSGVPWIVSNQPMVAEFFGAPLRTIEEWRKVGMPGQRGSYDLRAIYHWIRSRETTTVDSDALEWQRREKAMILQLERRRREGELVRVAEVQQIINRLASMLRETGELLQREHGPEAAAAINETLDTWLSQLKRMGDDSDGGKY